LDELPPRLGAPLVFVVRPKLILFHELLESQLLFLRLVDHKLLKFVLGGEHLIELLRLHLPVDLHVLSLYVSRSLLREPCERPQPFYRFRLILYVDNPSLLSLFGIRLVFFWVLLTQITNKFLEFALPNVELLLLELVLFLSLDSTDYLFLSGGDQRELIRLLRRLHLLPLWRMNLIFWIFRIVEVLEECFDIFIHILPPRRFDLLLYSFHLEMFTVSAYLVGDIKQFIEMAIQGSFERFKHLDIVISCRWLHHLLNDLAILFRGYSPLRSEFLVLVLVRAVFGWLFWDLQAAFRTILVSVGDEFGWLLLNVCFCWAKPSVQLLKLVCIRRVVLVTSNRWLFYSLLMGHTLELLDAARQIVEGLASSSSLLNSSL